MPARLDVLAARKARAPGRLNSAMFLALLLSNSVWVPATAADAGRPGGASEEAQNPPLIAHTLQASGTAAPDEDALELVQDLLSQRPAKELALKGVFKTRRGNGKRTEIPATYSVRLTAQNWESIYQTEPTPFQGPERLVVVHQASGPNAYLFTQNSLDGQKTNQMTLSGPEAALSFAGTDFWLSDLGLEFLHWPKQRLIRDAKITMRWGRPCKVLESTNPRPTESTYARVVSWIDSEMGSLIRAEAYGLDGRHFKVFELKSFKKINGRWQVKNMEIRNDRTDSRTYLEFTFDADQRQAADPPPSL
jgi:hypothetical protein